ncbi:MAG: amino acid permease-associated protein, partial [Halothiobacillaceae bacterium]
MARRFPASAGLRTYLKAAFGDAVSLFVVFMYLFLVLLIAGVESYVFAGIVEQFIPDFPRWLTIGLLLGAVITVNLAGVELPGRAQSLLTMLLVIGLLSVSLFALQSAPPALPVVPPVTEARWDLLPQIICLAFFMFVGFEWVIQVGRRPAAYQRLIPAAMLVSIVLLATIYGLFALALNMHLDNTQLSTTQTPQIVLGTHLLGEHGRWL